MEGEAASIKSSARNEVTMIISVQTWIKSYKMIANTRQKKLLPKISGKKRKIVARLATEANISKQNAARRVGKTTPRKSGWT